MGFIKAFEGAIGGTFADQWKDFYTPAQNVSATAAIFQAVPNGTNAGRGANINGSENIITNGSKIVVPEGTALITFQDGQITGFIAEAGGYEFKSDDPNSKSFFSGDGILSSTISESWERFKFGGQPSTQQLAFYVNLKEIAGLKFGTQSPVPYDDSFLETQVSVVARGTYSIQIKDPILFIKNLVPIEYYSPNAPVFDFEDMSNKTGEGLFTQLVSVLGAAFTKYSNDQEHGGRLSGIKANQVEFAKTLSEEVENSYKWRSELGLEIVRVAVDVEYDEKTQTLLDEIREDDKEIRKAKRMGQAYGNNMTGMMAAASGQAMQQAAGNEAGAMMGFMGMNMAGNAGANMIGAVSNIEQNQQPTPAPQQNIGATATTTNNNPSEDPYEKLTQMKQLLDNGVITQEDFDAAKKQLLGL